MLQCVMEETDLHWSGRREAPLVYVMLAACTLTYASVRGRRQGLGAGSSRQRGIGKVHEEDMQWEKRETMKETERQNQEDMP